MQYENEARVFFTAKSENEGFARLFAAGFLTQLDDCHKALRLFPKQIEF